MVYEHIVTCPTTLAVLATTPLCMDAKTLRIEYHGLDMPQLLLMGCVHVMSVVTWCILYVNYILG